MPTPARECNNALANAWQAAGRGDRVRLRYFVSTAYGWACRAGARELAAQIEDLLQNLSAVTNMQAAAEIDGIWTAIETRCVVEETARLHPQSSTAA